MVKHSLVSMRVFFTRERFGRPQWLAGMLLACFLAESMWLVRAEFITGEEPDGAEALRIREGWKQWTGRGVAGAPFEDVAPELARLAEKSLDGLGDFVQSQGTLSPVNRVSARRFDTEHSPLLYLVTSALLVVWPGHGGGSWWRWLPRLPFLACGVFLGASLWYVGRRLCGNRGGFVALTLYCFSPGMVQAGAVWHTEPEIAACWGAFGIVFTAIAVAHTLYAPREVVLWNWRRIVLLGTALAIAVGSQFSMVVLVPAALAFLLYVAPVRQGAAVVIWIAACAVAVVVLFATYFFHPGNFSDSMHAAHFWNANWRAFAVPAVYRHVGGKLIRICPALAFALPVALTSYLVWRRTRYFGNTAPLLMAGLFLVLGMAHPHSGGEGFLLASVPFLFLFVSGVLADLMETRYRLLVAAGVLGMLTAYAAWCIVNLARVQTG